MAKLRVITDSENICIGLIKAQKGMVTARNFRIEKINATSIRVRNVHYEEWEEIQNSSLKSHESIYFTEAVKFGFVNPGIAEADEQIACLDRQFRKGEELYFESNHHKPYTAFEEAGYEFAQAIDKLREIQLRALGKDYLPS